jgi:hypothetical protein
MQVERAEAEPQGEAEASGERVSNTWVIYPKDWDNDPKGSLIPDNVVSPHGETKKGESHLRMSPRPIS